MASALHAPEKQKSAQNRKLKLKLCRALCVSNEPEIGDRLHAVALVLGRGELLLPADISQATSTHGRWRMPLALKLAADAQVPLISPSCSEA